jgi:hypothetical protein
LIRLTNKLIHNGSHAAFLEKMLPCINATLFQRGCLTTAPRKPEDTLLLPERFKSPVRCRLWQKSACGVFKCSIEEPEAKLLEDDLFLETA